MDTGKGNLEGEIWRGKMGKRKERRRRRREKGEGEGEKSKRKDKWADNKLAKYLPIRTFVE